MTDERRTRRRDRDAERTGRRRGVPDAPRRRRCRDHDAATDGEPGGRRRGRRDARARADAAAASRAAERRASTPPDARRRRSRRQSPRPPRPTAEPAEPEPPSRRARARPSPAEPAGPRTVGRFIADALRAAGVRYAFTVPGESFLGLLEGLQAAGIRVVATRHEGAAAFMAEAHGQLTGRPAAASGPAPSAPPTSRSGSTPPARTRRRCSRSSARSSGAFRGREAFQEIDQATTIGGLASHAVEIRPTSPTCRGASATPSGPRSSAGPARPSCRVPEDLLDEELPAGTAARHVATRAARGPSPTTSGRSSSSSPTAERPVILAGGGVLRARTSTDLLRLAELLRVPVIAGWRRGDVISNDHPLYLGMAGYGSPAVVRERLERADAILVIGCRLSEITSFGYAIPARGPALDARRRRAARRAGRAAAARARPSDPTPGRSCGRPSPGSRRRVLDAASADARQAINDGRPRGLGGGDDADDDGLDRPGRPSCAASRAAPPADPRTTRSSRPTPATSACGSPATSGSAGPGTFLGPTSGAMGYALPAAIAAGLVHRDRVVVAFAGDGGFAMTMAELETAVREKAKVIAIVFDNERYGTIRMHQDRRGGGADGAIATDLGPIDFAAIARACGARGIRVETDAAFEQAVRQALANDRPTVIQVALDRGWVSPDVPFAAGG